MKIVMKDIFLKQILSIRKNYELSYRSTIFTRKKKLEKVEKLVYSIEDKEKYVIHIRALKQALNNGLKLKEVHRVIKFQQKAWLKSCIDMNTNLKKEAKSEFEKDFFMLMNNSVFRKQWKM